MNEDDSLSAGRLGSSVYERVTLTPASHEPTAPTQTRLGAFDGQGGFIEEFRVLRAAEASPVEVASHGPPRVHLEGTWVYGGVLRPHYGHFLLETLSRAWFIQRNPHLPIVWHAAHGKAVLAPWHREVFALLGIPEGRMHVVLHPTHVERIEVPRPGCVIERMLDPIHAQSLGIFPFSRYSGLGRKVWLSRSQLPIGLAKIEGETDLEHLLLDDGWTILHAQTLPVWRQLATLASADVIAGFEGSAFHSLLLADQVRAKVLLLRRNKEVFPLSHAMIADAKAFRQDILDVPLEHSGGEGRRQHAEMTDFCEVVKILDGATGVVGRAVPVVRRPAAARTGHPEAHAQPERRKGLAFVHIPKSAGTSFTRALALGWPRFRIVAKQSDLDEIPDAELAELDLIAGHYYAFRLEERTRAFEMVTVLRDPFERLFSAYRFGRHFALQGAKVGPAMRLAGELDFGAWAFGPGGGSHRHAQLYQLGLARGDRANDTPLSTLLDRAKGRLERGFVGTTDRLEQFVEFLFRRHSRGPAPTIERLMETAERTTPEEAGLTHQQRDALMDLLKPDYALMTFGRELMQRQLDENTNPSNI